MRRISLYTFLPIVLVGFGCGTGTGSGVSSLSSADVCNDYVNAGADLQARGQPCGEGITGISDVTKYCAGVAMCSQEGLQAYKRTAQCYRDLATCDPAQKMAWETRLSGCAAYAPTPQQCPAITR